MDSIHRFLILFLPTQQCKNEECPRIYIRARPQRQNPRRLGRLQGVIQRNSPLRNVSTTKTEVKTEVHKENDEPLRLLHKKKYCLNDRMIDETHKKSTESLKIRNHALMWDESAEKSFEVLNTKVTGTQAMHKYNSSKKNWNKIIDAPSGSAAAKKNLHKNPFDEDYNTEASTMSAVVLDTNDVPAAQSTHIQIVLSLVKKNSNKFRYFCRPKYVHGCQKYYAFIIVHNCHVYLKFISLFKSYPSLIALRGVSRTS